ncbi:hypothetical protein LWI28_016132 [Acer negundo]|uniref:Pathogen-related protein n=1 Tax=Acer negundo TaxID=4023 RepID=A0AAD5NWX8_ACENE|nr:hypothetical protein LWI28_016132 [Acer negundo]
MDQTNSFLLLDKVEASLESQMSSYISRSKESREGNSSSDNGNFPSQSFQVPISVPKEEDGNIVDGLPLKTPKKIIRKNHYTSKCHSMRTRNSKVSEAKCEQPRKEDAARVKTILWNLEEELAKVIEKGIALGANFKSKKRGGCSKEGSQEEVLLGSQGREGLSGEEVLKLGSYNALLKTSLPEEFKYYKAEEETFTSSHDAFRSAFPRGFAWEVLSVYSGPPVIAYKFRHWGFFEGPFKGHAPTGEMVEFYGFGTLKVDESLRAEDVEIYYDPAELFGGLLKGAPIAETSQQTTYQACPFSKNVF